MKTRANIITENVLYFTACLFIALFLLGWTCGCESPTGVEKDVYIHPDKLVTYPIDVSVAGKYRYVNSIPAKDAYFSLNYDGTYADYYIWNLKTGDEELNKFDGTVDTLRCGYWAIDSVGILLFMDKEGNKSFKMQYETSGDSLRMCYTEYYLSGCFNLIRVD